MLYLAEYRRKPALLADHLPWAALVGPGVVLNKDGSLQRSFRFRGPDMESATEAELIASCARLNNVLRRFGSGWALFFEAERHEAPGYPESDFPDPASWLVDQERRAAFMGEALQAGMGDERRAHYESRCFLTLSWLPPVDDVQDLGNLLLDRPKDIHRQDWRDRLEYFINETARAADLLEAIMPEFEALDDAGTLTYLHGIISTRLHPVAVPETPIYLDAILIDTPFSGGLEPMLGDRHLRTLTILGFPNLTRPGLLDALNELRFPYRWVTRFIALDKPDAERVLTRLRRQWFAKRKSIAAILREVLYNQPAPLLDSDADNKAVDADAALQDLGGDHVAYGYLTATVTVWDESREIAGDKLRAVEKAINGAGFATIRETINAVEAWFGSLPGHVYANVRQPLVHTLNLAHLAPLSGIWAGPERNSHLGAPPLFLAETRGSTPFRFVSHIGDVGHLMIVGPTGAGKSVLLALMALQFRRYPQSRIAIFDKDRSARCAVLAMGGQHHALALGGALAFQPLKRIDDQEERSWAADWIAGLLTHEKVDVTPEVKEAVWSALNNLAAVPVPQRTLTGLSVLLQSNPLKSALQPYTLEGPFGPLLDAAEEVLTLAEVTCFEMDALMQQGGVVLPVLTYLFHRLEAEFDGRPTLLILDEAWLFLDHPFFAARIRAWLKTLRKKNVAVIFAAPSLSDIASSSIAPAIIESCPQRIFLPNDRAIEPQIRSVYEGFGLNERQIELIAFSQPKRDYYLQSRRGNRLFELGLGPVALSFCAAASPDDQTRIDVVRAKSDPERFAETWLAECGLAWAAYLVEDNRSGRYPLTEDFP